MSDTRPLAIREIENQWIPLSDGTRLAARIWLPEDAAERPVPAILEYLPYRKDDGTARGDALRHPYFASRGYAAIRVDLRGTGDSDGLLEGEYLAREHADGLEVLAWIAAQPWCTGRIGMIGYSWGGFNGLQMAALAPPELGAVVTHASTDDRYLDDCHYMGGCMLGSDMLKWASAMLTYPLSPPDPRYVSENWRKMWMHRLENAPQLARDWVTHQRRDEFWAHGSVAEDYSAIRCPVMAVGGWADAYTNAVPRLLEHLQVPRLGIIGPWGHMMPYEGVPGPAIGFLQECVRFFDQCLKDIETGIFDEPLLRAWIQGHVEPAGFYETRPGRWIAEESWPPPGRQPMKLPLGTGQVRIRGSQECGETAGVWCANGNPDEIAIDQTADDERSWVYDTGPLEAAVELLGSPALRLRLASDEPLALISARLEEVAGDGSSLLVSWGLLNLTHRDSHASPEPLEPGRFYDVALELRVCGHRFTPGHRIRLALSPTYWPHAWPSPRPAALTLALDGCTLELPLRESDPDAPVPGFAPAETSPPLPPAPGDADHRARIRSFDPATDTYAIVDREHHEHEVAPGIRYAESWEDRYEIASDDPLSARVICVRDTWSKGPDRDWRIHVEAVMRCDESRFFITERIEAYQASEEVFSRTRDNEITRDLL